LSKNALYPSIILNEEIYPKHLGKAWLEGYKKIYDQRIAAKAKRKEDPKFETIQQALKLSLNGSYGKFNESFSWMYDPLCMFRTTIAGQLALIMLIETLEVAGIEVMSANTDGIVCLVGNKEEYLRICKEWEEKTNLVLEYTDYKLLAQTSVNDYMAVKTDGKPKFKGDFEVDKDIHKDHSMRIVRIALMRYFLLGIPVKMTVESHLGRQTHYEHNITNNGIYDFCLAKRALRGFKLETHEVAVINGQSTKKIVQQQKNTRYYISNKGKAFYKRKVESGKLTRMNVGYEVEVFNKYIEKDQYNINYQFYIRECNKIIDQIEDKQLKLNLFQ